MQGSSWPRPKGVLAFLTCVVLCMAWSPWAYLGPHCCSSSVIGSVSWIKENMGYSRCFSHVVPRLHRAAILKLWWGSRRISRSLFVCLTFLRHVGQLIVNYLTGETVSLYLPALFLLSSDSASSLEGHMHFPLQWILRPQHTKPNANSMEKGENLMLFIYSTIL